MYGHVYLFFNSSCPTMFHCHERQWVQYPMPLSTTFPPPLQRPYLFLFLFPFLSLCLCLFLHLLSFLFLFNCPPYFLCLFHGPSNFFYFAFSFSFPLLWGRWFPSDLGAVEYILYFHFPSSPRSLVPLIGRLDASDVLHPHLHLCSLSIILQHFEVHEFLLEVSLQGCQGRLGVRESYYPEMSFAPGLGHLGIHLIADTFHDVLQHGLHDFFVAYLNYCAPNRSS